MTRRTPPPPPAVKTTYRATRRVEFRDTDAAGIMHFSAFFTMMEEVEHEFLRQLGLSVHMPDPTGIISWPRVAAQCDYRGAARFEDVLDIELHVRSIGRKSVTYGFTFTDDERLVAEGQLTVVCCRIEADAPPKSIAIPDWFLEKLGPPPTP